MLNKNLNFIPMQKFVKKKALIIVFEYFLMDKI